MPEVPRSAEVEEAVRVLRNHVENAEDVSSLGMPTTQAAEIVLDELDRLRMRNVRLSSDRRVEGFRRAGW